MNSVSYTIVGVLPPFRLANDVDVFIPLGQGDPFFNDRRFPGVLCIARLKHGVTIAQAQTEMTTIQQSIDQLYPDTDRGLGTDVVALKPVIVGDISTTLLLMLGRRCRRAADRLCQCRQPPPGTVGRPRARIHHPLCPGRCALPHHPAIDH